MLPNPRRICLRGTRKEAKGGRLNAKCKGAMIHAIPPSLKRQIAVTCEYMPSFHITSRQINDAASIFYLI